ncbi:MAG TPA: PLP-dependent aminotransferase family protein [Solirubrobacteraceae bacterium]
MDPQVARTLEELERKIIQLERTLSAMNRDSDAPAGNVSDEPERERAHTDGAPADGGSAPAWPPAPGGSRIVDETVEHPSGGPPPAARWEAPPPSATSSETASPPPVSPPPASSAPTVSPPLAASPPPLPPAPGPPAPHLQAPASHLQAPASRLQAPGPLRGAGSRRPDELLRFRDRLERAARDLTHDYDELLGRLSYAAVPTSAGPTISFARGAPSLDIVDVDGLRDAAVRAFESDPAGTTAYGTSVGYPRLRSWIADRHGVGPERVLVTNGSMQADAFLFEQLVRSGDEVIVERPSYDRTLLSLRERGARLHAVELQPDGIDTDALADLLDGGSVRPKLAHIIPNFQNPAGYTLSLPKRTALLELARGHGFVIFEDDPYISLRFTGEALPTMLSMDAERVVYASSFSKTVCPGIRVGYLVGPADLIGEIARLATNTYISPNMVAQSIVYEFCASGAIDRSIETAKTALEQRASTLAEALRRDLPEAEFVSPEGGYFMWVTLPHGTDVHALFTAAAERGVSFVKGTDFLLEGGENTLRLAYSGVTPEQIDTGIARLAEAFRAI